MDYGQLKPKIYDFILAIRPNYPDELQQQFNMISADIESETNGSKLLCSIDTLTNMVKKYNSDHGLIQHNLFDEKMIHLKEKHDALQTALSDIEQKGGPNLHNVKVQLQELFNSLSNVIHYQNNKISDLESKVNYLSTKSKLDEKRRLIADVLNPLTDELHKYLDGLSDKPHRYDDSCIYKAFQAKLVNSEPTENQYKSFYGKVIDETTYQQFYGFLLHKANQLNIGAHSLISLLYEKKKSGILHNIVILMTFCSIV